MATSKKNIEILNKVPLLDAKGKKGGELELNSKIFTGEFNTAVIHQLVKAYLANKRAGTASTKQRDDVRGGGKKPWRQKGTGRARVGSSRNPLWRGGGVAFGPHPRDFSETISKKLKRSGLKHSLNSKLQDKSFYVIEDISVSEPKTKDFLKVYNNTKLTGSTLLAVDKKDSNLNLSSRNVNKVTVVLYSDLNAYDVMKNKNFLITKKGVDMLSERLKG